MRYYIIAGEASGDLHASNLIREIKIKDTKADFRIWGGDLMQEQGAYLVKHYRDLAFMGFWEVFMNLKTVLGNISFCKKDLLKYQPDVLVLVDYPGFNLRIAQFAHQHHIKTVYYISPQIWAWKKNRIKGIRKNVDRMMVILPFEADFYAQHGYRADFVGHPLLDVMQNRALNINTSEFRKKHQLNEKPIIALLPGSRKQEISIILPLMLGVIEDFPEYQFVVSGVSWQPKEVYEKLILSSKVKIVYGETYDLLLNSEAALVTSGTATLETALLNIPEVVCYKGSRISYEIAKRLIKSIQYISLVNLICQREVVQELIQIDATRLKMIEALKKILVSGEDRVRIYKDYQELKLKLGTHGASEKAAEIVVSMATK